MENQRIEEVVELAVEAGAGQSSLVKKAVVIGAGVIIFGAGVLVGRLVPKMVAGIRNAVKTAIEKRAAKKAAKQANKEQE